MAVWFLMPDTKPFFINISYVIKPIQTKINLNGVIETIKALFCNKAKTGPLNLPLDQPDPTGSGGNTGTYKVIILFTNH